MKIIKYYKNWEKLAINCLLNDKIIVIPTDTCYGIVALNNKKNLQKINKIKLRKSNQKIPVLISNITQIKFDSQKLKKILEKKWEEHTTIILNKNKIGYRLIFVDFLTNIIKKTGPIIATSFNLHNEKPIVDLNFDINKFKNIEYAFIFKNFISKKPSKIIEYKNDKIIFLRE